MIEVTEFTAALHLAAKALQFYTAEHPRGVEALTNLDRAASALLEGRPRVSIVAAKETLLVDGTPIAMDGTRKAHVKALAHELEARQFGGLVITQGVSYREHIELVRLFVMKPPQIVAAGGAEEILQRAGVIHIRISNVRYEAITEDEEVVWSKTARRAEELAAAGSGDSLPILLRRFLLKNANASPAGEIPEGIDLGAKADEIAANMPERVRELLKEAIDGVEPEVQLALLLNIGRLPPGALRDALQPAARELLGGAEPTDADALTRLLGTTTFDAEAIELLRARLEELGISREQLDEVIGVIGWERLSTNEKIEKLLTGSIFDVPREKLVVFIRELLGEHRYDDVLRLLETYARGLEHDAFAMRQDVADTFGQIAGFIDTPGVNPPIEQLLTRVILNHFVKESDARMHRTVADAVASLCTALVKTGRADVALRTLTRLEAAIAVADREAAVRKAYDSLGPAFGEPKRAAQLIVPIFTAEPEALNKSVIPLVAQLGAPLMPALIDALTHEDDRNRRGRVVRALKAIGKPGHPFLLDALQSPAWYVIRNSLGILGEIGEREHVSAIGKKLQHGDARVRRAAARALGKIGGVEAETLLVAAIGDRDSETQGEVFLCLGSMKAQSAVPALSELARTRSTAGDVRELAMTTLGQIGSDAAVPLLGEIVRPKGLFAREALSFRLAAAKALAAIGTPEARQTLQNSVAAESDRATRDALATTIPRP
jgi:HEAT repeat protein